MNIRSILSLKGSVPLDRTSQLFDKNNIHHDVLLFRRQSVISAFCYLVLCSAAKRVALSRSLFANC